MLASKLKPYLINEGLKAENTYVAKVCDLMKERATFVQDILREGRYFFEAPVSYDENHQKNGKNKP